MRMRWRGGLAVGLLVLFSLLLSAVPAAGQASAGGSVSDTVKYGGHTLSYTVTGVTTGPGDTPAHRAGTVTGATVAVSGSASFTIDEVKDSRGPGNAVMIEVQAEHVTQGSERSSYGSNGQLSLQSPGHDSAGALARRRPAPGRGTQPGFLSGAVRYGVFRRQFEELQR